MTFLLTAMYCEAAPVINKMKMKKVLEIKQFQVFRTEDTVLIISGIGSIKAAAATAFILTYYNCKKEDMFVNLGVCGDINRKHRKGQILLCSKIIDNASNNDYYPDMLFKSPFEEAVLETFQILLSEKLVDNPVLNSEV